MMDRCKRLLCVLLCLLLLPCVACAGQGSITLSLMVEGNGLAGAEFSVYRVAALVNGASFALLPGYDAGDYDVNKLESAGDWAALAELLAGQATSGGTNVTTNESGLAKLDGLEDGMYLVVGKKAELGGWTYDFAPFVMSLPGKEDGGWSRDVQADVKHEREPVKCDIRMVKLWKDEGYTKQRPESIKVDLMRNGEKHMELELNAANNWSQIVTGLESIHEWTAREQVPEGYQVEYAWQEGALVITNTLIKKPAPPPDIPQTGLTWWPVPVLDILGAVLFIIGWAMRRRESIEHEEA
ncbi:MAG: Cna B-type domain-containing protein [Clostridia bacterium]|nr:Cna B-type domain-containing protein [Clostridia bacterium]